MVDRISDLARDLDSQTKDKVKSFVAFLVANGESMDITDVAHMAIFTQDVDEILTINAEFLELLLMTDTTTANDIFKSLFGELDKVRVDCACAVSLASDGAPSVIWIDSPGRKSFLDIWNNLPLYQAFSVMSLNKTKLQPRLTQKHLNDILKHANDQDFIPNIDALVNAKRSQVSGARS